MRTIQYSRVFAFKRGSVLLVYVSRISTGSGFEHRGLGSDIEPGSGRIDIAR
jgi:hypothetical protein